MNTPDRLPQSSAGRRFPAFLPGTILGVLLVPAVALADGKVVAPRQYAGSLEERAQEAIIIFQGSDTRGEAVEDLILKIRVEGEIDRFAWVIPFPTKPTTGREDAKLFQELHGYVETRIAQGAGGFKKTGHTIGAVKGAEPKAVEVLSRQTVGSYDVSVVRENVAGNLNGWLRKEGYQELPDAEDVIGFYRKKGYVFACIKVADAQLGKVKAADLHPLRFTFRTGGRDGIYFPMKMTGLQKEPFDVNLYVFYRFWINDRLSKFGYVHRGFQLRYRDWDSPACEPDAGKAYSAPDEDPFLRPLAHRIPTVAKLFQKLHPGAKYYLTNIQGWRLRPKDVRAWSDDLWLFPYYRSRDRVPYDVRDSGPASAGWPNEPYSVDDDQGADEVELEPWAWFAIGGGALLVVLLGVWAWRRRSEY
jgi:hypothetical protein